MAKAKANRRTKVDPFDVFVNAYGFYATTITLDKRPEKNIFVWSILVTESLSLELFLKCAHVMRRRNPRKYGHNIRKLFGGLSQKDRQTIEREYDRNLALYPLTPKLIKEGVLLDLDSVLSRANGVFEAMRYWHEFPEWPRDSQGRSSNAGIGVLLNGLIFFLREENPDWESRYETLALKGHDRFYHRHEPLPT